MDIEEFEDILEDLDNNYLEEGRNNKMATAQKIIDAPLSIELAAQKLEHTVTVDDTSELFVWCGGIQQNPKATKIKFGDAKLNLSGLHKEMIEAGESFDLVDLIRRGQMDSIQRRKFLKNELIRDYKVIPANQNARLAVKAEYDRMAKIGKNRAGK